MSTFKIKKRSLTNFTYLLASLFYGFFVVLSLFRLDRLGSGDIHNYVDFFNSWDIYLATEYFSITGDGVFRLAVMYLVETFGFDVLSVLSFIAFIISSLFIFIFLTHIRTSRGFLYIFPLLLFIFLTPQVTNLFASGIRSGIAFTIFMLGLINFRGTKKYVLFLISISFHLSMVPLAAIYFLFKTLKKMNFPNNLMYFGSFLYSISVVALSETLGFTTPVAQSWYFIFLIFYIAFLIFFLDKKTINNLYGFFSISLITIFLIGSINDASFIRYIGYSFLFYLFFLIKEGMKDRVLIFTICYFPVFVLTSIYTILNFL